ncbi:MAG: hypothetical protein ABJA67_17040, partial [Chthonomonadales bacterium]
QNSRTFESPVDSFLGGRKWRFHLPKGWKVVSEPPADMWNSSASFFRIIPSYGPGTTTPETFNDFQVLLWSEGRARRYAILDGDHKNIASGQKAILTQFDRPKDDDHPAEIALELAIHSGRVNRMGIVQGNYPASLRKRLRPITMYILSHVELVKPSRSRRKR